MSCCGRIKCRCTRLQQNFWLRSRTLITTWFTSTSCFKKKTSSQILSFKVNTVAVVRRWPRTVFINPARPTSVSLYSLTVLSDEASARKSPFLPHHLNAAQKKKCCRDVTNYVCVLEIQMFLSMFHTLMCSLDRVQVNLIIVT